MEASQKVQKLQEKEKTGPNIVKLEAVSTKQLFFHKNEEITTETVCVYIYLFQKYFSCSQKLFINLFLVLFLY